MLLYLFSVFLCFFIVADGETISRNQDSQKGDICLPCKRKKLRGDGRTP